MERKIMPFYLTYPDIMDKAEAIFRPAKIGRIDNRQYEKDVEYFRQMYPQGAKQIQKEIEKALAILDYDGSVIYDEYPERLRIDKMAKDILETIRSKVWDGECVTEQEAMQLQKLIGCEQIQDYVLLVLLQEILLRRQLKNRVN
ncbi:MAG: hypothetical protein E7294_08145 [Lachnospiraceae bacterium]|nr:hypothetical protein [Lachnospiraceae bacterium]